MYLNRITVHLMQIVSGQGLFDEVTAEGNKLYVRREVSVLMDVSQFQNPFLLTDVRGVSKEATQHFKWVNVGPLQAEQMWP